MDSDESRYATRQGLFSAGAAMMARQPSPVPTSPLSSLLNTLGTGIQAGQGGAMEGLKTYEGMMAAQVARGKQARLQSVMQKYQGATPEQMQGAVNDLVANGLYEEAATVSRALKSDADRLMQVDTGANIELRNPTTGDPVKTIPKGMAPNAPNPTRDDARALYGQFLQQTTKHLDVADAYRRIRAAGDNPSAAGDIGLLTAYMKLVDPGSTVREGEFATAANAGGIPDRLKALYNRLLDGKRLSEDQRSDFINQAGLLARTMKDSLDQVISGYRDRAENSGIDTKKYNVTYDYFRGLDMKVDPLSTHGDFLDGKPPK